MVGYFLTSPIFGALGDCFRRRELIALGVAVWSLATAASGMMRTFLALVGMRVIVGVGEASYATLAPTIIDDLAPPSTKNRWLSVFYVAIPVGWGARLSARRVSRAPLRVAQRFLHCRRTRHCPRAPGARPRRTNPSRTHERHCPGQQQHMGHLACPLVDWGLPQRGHWLHRADLRRSADSRRGHRPTSTGTCTWS